MADSDWMKYYSQGQDTFQQLLRYLEKQQEAKATDLLNQQQAAAGAGGSMVDVLRGIGTDQLSRTQLASNLLRRDPYTPLRHEVRARAAQALFSGEDVGPYFGEQVGTGYGAYLPMEFKASPAMQHLTTDPVLAQYKRQADVTAKQISPEAATIDFSSIFPNLAEGAQYQADVSKTGQQVGDWRTSLQTAQQEWAKKQYDIASKKESGWSKVWKAMLAVLASAPAKWGGSEEEKDIGIKKIEDIKPEVDEERP